VALLSDEEVLVGFRLDDSTGTVLERTHAALTGAASPALPPLGWLAAVARDLGAVAVADGSDDAFVEALIELATTALLAVDAHSLHPLPGQSADPETLLALAFHGVRAHVRDRGWYEGAAPIWIARLTELAGVYASALLASPDVVPTASDRSARLEAAGPAALDVAACALLAASVTMRDMA
jgi:hypothetical protein